MNKTEAQSILDEQLASFTRRSYADLVAMIDHPQAVQTKGPSGLTYNIEFNVFYDDSHRKHDLRIIGAIDDGGCLSSMFPVSKDEIMKPTRELT